MSETQTIDEDLNFETPEDLQLPFPHMEVAAFVAAVATALSEFPGEGDGALVCRAMGITLRECPEVRDAVPDDAAKQLCSALISFAEAMYHHREG